MAATNKLSSIWPAFRSHMLGLVGNAGTNSTVNIATVEEGEVTDDAFQTPFVAIQLISFKVISLQGEEKVWEAKIKIRCVSDVTTANGATTEGIAKSGLITDQIESFARPTGMNQGLENITWSYTYPTDPNAGGHVVVECDFTFKINVSKTNN